jgi:RNA polymerase sigma-70 factor (ECF subfamily)
MEKFIGLAPVDSKLMSEQQAITILKQGNINGLSIFVQKYQAKAVHAAFLITRDRDLSEDVIQDAYLQAYRKIDQFDNSRPFGPWFLRIVINAAIKAAQRQKRSLPLEEPEGVNSISEWLIDPSKSPEKLTESAEIRELVWQAMEQLTPNQRAAIVLRYFLEKNESEMIQDLDQPATTIKWWLYAARQRLRQLLQPIEINESPKKEIKYD